MYKAEILADSINPQGNRLTTMKITFPRFILAEFNTHRMFSRNSASSRAIPFKKMVQMVEENPFIPIAWQKDHKGMQGNDYLTDEKIIDFKKGVWLNARNKAVESAKELFYNVSRHTSLNDIQELEGTSVTKQLCNRLLEPFMWHTVVVTSGKEGLENFFKLRCPQYQDAEGNTFKSKKDYKTKWEHVGAYPNNNLQWLSVNKSQADIHIQAIAEMMWDEFNSSTPKQLKAGEWHIPDLGHKWDIEKLAFITKSGDTFEETNKLLNLSKIKVATAHCAKISYDNFGTKVDYEADIKLFDRLLLAEPPHASPGEHVAQAQSDSKMYKNFKGFKQVRQLIEESVMF